jgi:uncharacterized protein (TIGR02268 family)
MPTYPVYRRLQVQLQILLLVSTAAGAHAPQPMLCAPRSIYFSKDAQAEVPEVFVAGGRVTSLRFPTACDPNRTSLLGWEGRFEPLLVGGRSVVLVPLQNLAPGDRFMLRVTLVDGSELPFTVTASEDRVDGQINVFPELTSPEAVQQALSEKTQENEVLVAENRRHRQEESSVDHAIATLLVNDQVELTPFIEGDTWLLREGDVEVKVTLLVPKGKVAPRKAAVIVTVKNKSLKKSWELLEARLSTFTTREPWPFALRTTSSIAPGKTGRIAVVTDFDSFDSSTGGGKLVLELFRDGGLRQVCIVLVPRDRR